MAQARAKDPEGAAAIRWIGCCPDAFAGSAALAPLMAATGFEGPVPPEKGRAALKGDAAARLALLYPAAEAFAAQAEEGGVAAATLAWSEAMQALLAVFREARGRCALVEIGTGLRHPRALAARLALPPGAAERVHPVEPPQADPLLGSLIRAVLLRDPVSRGLLGEIEAASVALAPEGQGDSVDAALARYRELQTMVARSAILEEELAALRREIVATADRADRVAPLERQLEDARASLATLEQRLVEATREGRAAQEDCAALGARLEEREARIREAEDEVARILRSRSVRMTEPLRRLRALMARSRRGDG